jgi:amino acid transporter
VQLDKAPQVPILDRDIADPPESQSQRFSFRRILRAWDVFFVCTLSVVNLNLLTITASAGFRVFWLWLIAIPCFVVPQAIAVVEITYSDRGECGLSLWNERYLGRRVGFLSSWCYWLNNVPYVPSVLVYMVAIVAFIFPALGAMPHVQWALSLLLLWGIVGLNMTAFGTGRWIRWIACSTFVVIFAVIWLGVRYGIRHYHGHIDSIAGGIPALDLETASVFGLICMSMIGVEIGSVFGDEINASRAAIAWAAVRGSGASLFCYLLATAALLIGMHGAPLSSSTGLLDYVQHTLQGPGVRMAVAGMAVFICIAQTGAGLCWFGAASRMMWLCSTEGGLPPSLSALHPRWRTPHRAIVIQGVLCSVVLLLCFLGTAAQEAYLTMLDIAVVVQLLPYIAIFLALVRHATGKTSFQRWLFTIAGILGAVTTLFGIVIAFVPSRAISNIWQHEIKLVIGCALSVWTGFWAFTRQSSKKTGVALNN